MYFNAKDELVTIVPNFSLPTENGGATCISGEWGPFAPNREARVPLWLAHSLWKRKRCAIRPPDWMNAEHLEAVLALERQDASAFQPLPFHYIEVARFLFTAGTDGHLAQEVFGEELARVRLGLEGGGAACRGCAGRGPAGGGLACGPGLLITPRSLCAPSSPPLPLPHPTPPRPPQVRDLVECVQKARMAKILAGLATLQGAITVKLNNLGAMEVNAGGWAWVFLCLLRLCL